MSSGTNNIKGSAPSLRDISPQQWRSGIAAWLGWLFDGLDMHLYVLVSAAFVAQLLNTTDTGSPDVKIKSSFIQAAFLIGWAIGGTVFGRIGDLIGRSRALSLTILTYAVFTGLSTLATTWWMLMIFRFVSALGIGGEWAVGSSLLSETWPKQWRAWVAAVLQTGVNVGVLVACGMWAIFASIGERYSLQMERYLFLVGVLPAFAVFWIRKKVPEPAEWHAAKAKAGKDAPSVMELFRGPVLKITLCTMAVCAFSLTAWWAFLFWDLGYLRGLTELKNPFVKAVQPQEWQAWHGKVERIASFAFFMVIGVSVAGNFFAAWVARRIGYRKGIMLLFAGFFACFMICYGKQRDYQSLIAWMSAIGFFSGVFGLFTMYLPPLFPTLLRTTGAGFCFNVGRIAAAVGTVVFVKLADVLDVRQAMLWDGCLFIPAIIVALYMPDMRDTPGPEPRDVPQESLAGTAPATT